MAMDQYLYLHFLGMNIHFDVHQGDRVLTHPHISKISVYF